MSYRKRVTKQYSLPRRGRPLWLISQVTPSTPRLKRQYISQWDVQSHTDPSKHYRVSMKPDGSYECSCPQWIYRHKECKHIGEVKNLPLSTAAIPVTAPKEVVVVYDKEGVGRLVV